MDMREAMKQSCDVYFYEVAENLVLIGWPKPQENSDLAKPVLDGLMEERTGVVPNTKWKKKYVGKNWYLGETLHAGIGQVNGKLHLYSFV